MQVGVPVKVRDLAVGDLLQYELNLDAGMPRQRLDLLVTQVVTSGATGYGCYNHRVNVLAVVEGTPLSHLVARDNLSYTYFSGEGGRSLASVSVRRSIGLYLFLIADIDREPYSMRFLALHQRKM